MMMQQRRVTRSMTGERAGNQLPEPVICFQARGYLIRADAASRWASMPAEILGSFQAASAPHNFPTVRPLSQAQRLPSIVKIQLVCKAWYQAAGNTY